MLSVEQTALRKLKLNPRNPRSHSQKQIAQLAAIIQHVGFNNPIITDEHYIILAGHGRYRTPFLVV